MHFDVTNFRRYLDMLTSEQIEQLLAVGRSVIAERRTAEAMKWETQQAIDRRCALLKGPDKEGVVSY